MRLTFPLLAIISLVCSPILYLQSKKVRKEVPDLPEASNPKGIIQYEGKANFNLLVIGESTMAGVGIKDHRDGFACHLATQISKHLHQTVIWEVHAKSGYTAKQIYDQLLPKVERKHASLIVIGTGANDAFSLNTPSHFSKDIDKVIAQLRQCHPDCPIVFINMPPVSYFPAFTKLMQFCIGNWVKFNGEKLETLSKNYQQVYYMKDDIRPEDWFDRYDHFNNIDDMFSDGVHPSKMTYQLWAEECFEYIVSQGQIKSSKIDQN